MLRLVSQILINMDSSLADLLFLIKIIGTSKGVGAAFYGINHNVHSGALFTDRAKILIHLSAADHIGSLYQDIFFPFHGCDHPFPYNRLLIFRLCGIRPQFNSPGFHGSLLPVLF